MHFADLEPCTYASRPDREDRWQVPLLAIGWLEADYSFTSGEADQELIDRAKQFQEETRTQFTSSNYRGFHGCTLCDSGVASDWIEGSHTNLYIPGKGCVYMASGGIVHYMEDHAYAPPERFVVALRSCPSPSSQEYVAALIAANAGNKPELLMTFDELFPELHRRKRANNLAH